MSKLYSVWNYTEIEWYYWSSNSWSKKVSDIGKNVHQCTDNLNNWTISKEKLEVINNNLSEKQINAIWWNILALESMTESKITIIGFMLSREEIKKEWAERLAKISVEELNEITKKYM